MALSAGELSKLVDTVLAAAKKADAGDTAEQGRAVDGLKALKKQLVTTKVLAETQAGKRIKSLVKHGKSDVAAAAAAVVAAWKDAVRQEANGGSGGAAAATGGVGTGTASAAVTASTGGGSKQAPAGPSSKDLAAGSSGGEQQQQRLEPSSQQTVTGGGGDSGPAGGAPATAQQPVQQIDPGSIPRSGDPLRDRCRQNLAAAFQLAVTAGVAGDPVVCGVAVENEIFNQNGGVTQAYKAKFRNLHFNLKDPANPDLRRKVLSGQITPDELVVLPPEELASDAKRQENQRIREKKLFDSAPSAAKQATTDQFQCGKCRQRKTTYYQMQTRSADEPMTTFVTCLNCNNRWKFC